MSSTEPVEGASAVEPPHEATDGQMSTRKSYRRKYRKIMVTFEEKMRESNSLFKEEHRLMDISLRLAEQTDQLLELLLELNSCPQVPPRLRYDLSSEKENAPLDGEPNPSVTHEHANLELQKARARLQNGEMDLVEYREIQANLLKSPGFAPTKSYPTLLSLGPPSIQPLDRTDSAQGVLSGLLSIKQEEQYIQGLDAYLEGTSSAPRPYAMNNLGSRVTEKNTERERETQLRNPVSVYNWLRKHQPQVFLQDNETGVDKTPRAAGSRSSARKFAQQKDIIKQEKDYDDEGFAADKAPSRSKRKRDDDGGYRPKGGTSRGSKRRKETKEDPVRAKRAKKQSTEAI